MNEFELQTRNTAAFIAADPEILALAPRSRQGDGVGGYRMVSGAERPGIVARLIPVSDGASEQQTSDGVFARPEFRLLAMPSATVLQYDRFVWRGRTWEVTQVHMGPAYETKGDVVRVV